MSRAPEEHPHRNRILAYLGTNPGASLQELADHLGLHRNAAAHHVRVLQGARHVVTMRQGRRVLHFHVGTHGHEVRGMMGLMRLGTVRSILGAVAEDPEISLRAIARQLSVTRHTVRWHLRRLEGAGVLERHASPGAPERLLLDRQAQQLLLQMGIPIAPGLSAAPSDAGLTDSPPRTPGFVAGF